MTNPVADFIVRNNGSIDLEASRAKFTAALELYTAERETEDASVADAVNAVFDQYKGAAVNLPALKSLALGKLNATHAQFALLSDRVGNYVKANPSLFEVKKGKGGGVSRLADKPAPATEQK